jgi:hypothetical protein
MPVEYSGTRDPLYRDPPIDHTVTIPVLGLPVRFASNARAVIDVVESAFHAWRVVEALPGLVEPAGARVTIVVHPGDGENDGRVRLRHRMLSAHRVLLAGDGNMSIVDPARREACAWVTPAFVSDTQHFRYSLVEAITMALITPLDRQPFHAACLVRDGAAVLLTGPSGIGKSSLSWAAIRHMQDVTVLAEDAVYLQSSPQLRVWGLPGFIHLPPDTANTFPELADALPVMLANGKTKIAVDVRATNAASPVPFVDRASVCVLTRGGTPSIRPLSSEALLDRLLSRMEDGFDRFADTIGEPLGMLARRGGWSLELPPDPRDALPWIDRVLREVEAAAA